MIKITVEQDGKEPVVFEDIQEYALHAVVVKGGMSANLSSWLGRDAIDLAGNVYGLHQRILKTHGRTG